jgi:hypothetical protein
VDRRIELAVLLQEPVQQNPQVILVIGLVVVRRRQSNAPRLRHIPRVSPRNLLAIIAFFGNSFKRR